VYIDAAHAFGKWSGPGIIIIDTETNECWIAGGKVFPAKTLQPCLRANSGPLTINQLELLALVTAVTTFPEPFKNRDCLVFLDIVSCLKADVHGTAKVEDMSEMANVLHISLARLRVNAVFLHVPGLVNPADIP